MVSVDEDDVDFDTGGRMRTVCACVYVCINMYINAFLTSERTLTLRGRRVTLPRPLQRSSSAAGSTILPLCRAAPRCVSVSVCVRVCVSSTPTLATAPTGFCRK